MQTGTGSAVPEEYAITDGGDRLGTFYKQDNVYAYELRDQLGNVRATIAQSGTTLEVRGYSDYYPYGMVLRSGGTTYRYGYQGAYAEKDGETDWNAFELRMYDSRIARWLTYDPKPNGLSPYAAMGGDPIKNFDIKGDTPTVREAALMSLDSYSKFDPNDANQQELQKMGWNRVDKIIANIFGQTKQEISLNDLGEATGFNMALYEKITNGKPEWILANAGTADMVDVGSDAANLVGGSLQFNFSVRFARSLQRGMNG